MPSDQTEAQPWYNPTATEEALRESEERYYAMFQHMNSGVAVFRAVDGGGDFVFKDLNEAAERISRIRRKEVIGKRLLATFPDVEKYGLPGIIGRVFRTGTPEQLPAARYRDQTREAWREGFAYRLPSGDVVMIYDDVTDRVNAEIALRESEKKYRQLVELAQEGIWVGDREWNTTFVNPRFAEMLGYALSDMPGRNIADYMDPGDLPDHGIRMARRTQGKNETYERKFRHRDGSYRWFLVSATALHDDAGNFSGSYAVFTDITDRKLAGEALRESEERQRLLIEYSGLGIAYWDYSGRLMFLNRKGIENMGGCVEDFTGKHVTELFPGDRAKEFAERISSMKDAFGSRVYEDLVPLPGGPRWFLSTFTNVLDTGGNPSGVQIISQDITDRKEAEEKLEISEILYRTIFETSGSATAILDRDGNILIANAETAPLFGYAPQELEGKVHWSALVLPDELPRLAEFWRLLHADPGSGQRYEARLLDRRGTVKHGLLCVRMIPSTQNCVVSVTDITERKNAEEALAQSEERYRAVLESQTEFITRFTPDSTVT
ncbi:MAG TPA: PAS domain S-box protein, partial [Methanomicrobiales archaeon]|nr:PAS domain S-box protein [Methanomicrobiales archaeon]